MNSIWQKTKTWFPSQTYTGEEFDFIANKGREVPENKNKNIQTKTKNSVLLHGPHSNFI